MPDLTYRQQKIQEKRKQTSFRDFVREIASWRPLQFYRNAGFISKYPTTERSPKLISSQQYEEARNTFTDTTNIELQNNFFETFQQLFQKTSTEPTGQFAVGGNTTYADPCWRSKNVYLSTFVVSECENILYSVAVRENCINVYNSNMVFENCNNVYQSAGVINSYNIFYSKYIKNCADVRFSKNLLNCSFCIGCANLENKSYYINNQQYSKEEYLQLIQRPKRKQIYLKKQPPLIATDTNMGSKNISGTFCSNSEDVENGYFSYNQHLCRNIYFAGGAGGNEHLYDVFI
ncbi:MAG: hypothetical protein LBB34_02255 [Holosporales bacterium]|jgi:hypothetical protein|nr:hypothetical protein [Holosporales bacterium]